MDPGSPGSLGIAISEAVEAAATSNGGKKYGIGSVLGHVLLHQTVIGLEALDQMEMAGEYPDIVIGCAGGGRAVGRALAENPFPILIPCHRAVRSDGGIGGYQGGSAMKRSLLAMEGVEFIGEDRVSMAMVYY